MPKSRSFIGASALVCALLLVFSPAAHAAQVIEASQTVPVGGAASFSVVGFSLSSHLSPPAALHIVANNSTIANAQTFRNVIYYALSWDVMSSQPAQVQAALWYIAEGNWTGAHDTAQRLVDAARAPTTPATNAPGYSLLFALNSGKATATASFSGSSGSIQVTNKQDTPIIVYVPYGTILAGPDNLPAYIVYSLDSSPAPATLVASTPTLPAGQPTGGVSPNATALPTAAPTHAGNAGLSGSGTATSTPMPATDTPLPTNTPLPPTATPIPPTVTPLPPTPTAAIPASNLPAATNTAAPTIAPTALPANPTSQPLKQAATNDSGGTKLNPAALPTAVETDVFPTPQDTGEILPTPGQTVYPTNSPAVKGLATLTPSPTLFSQPGVVPTATSIFVPTATLSTSNPATPATGTGTGGTGTGTQPKPTTAPAASKPTATLPSLVEQPPLEPTPQVFDPNAGGGNVGNSGGSSGTPPNTAPNTGEQSNLPLYLLIGGIVAIIIGVVVMRMSNQAKK